MSTLADGKTDLACRTDEANGAMAVLLQDLDSGLFKALSEPTRQRIVSILLQHGRLNVLQIKEFCPQDRSVISRHLKFLRESGVVIHMQEGRYAYYELNGFGIIVTLRRILEQMQVLMASLHPNAWAEFEAKRSR
ncbi:ArsR/SmtB family transcription factor [Chitinolyticbacter meiyuanensis]|uniref:ArsR/SmtB family transcription factor n=1 Tax=Chitinolyticbacter meiyuanensis TaxID=682798 RepID=UPI0011E5C4DF|nr:metalloregulator ArsR/SmtB family transcription factor [Chitinolyticbacter meiyuanensis]